jgi:hypothetical protein
MKTKLILTVIICAVAFAACKKKKEDVPSVTPVAKKVYVAGYEENSIGTYIGRYWVDTSASVISVANADVELIDIEVVGTDRFIFGEVNPNSGPTKYTVWKNGTVLYEIPYNRSFVPTRMAVSGSDVYLCGNSENTATNGLRPAIWKNGTVSILSQGYNLAYLSCIYVVGSTVYTAGLEYSSTQAFISVWANGTRQVLATNETAPSSITVSGTDVYVTGTDGSKPAYWKNGTKILLSVVSAAAGGYCSSIVVSGNDVYACGYENTSSDPDRAVYWKNGVRTALTSIGASFESYANNMEVDGNDVYVCGTAERNSNGDYSAVLWKNGVLTNLTPASTYAEVSSIKIR